MSLPYHSEDLQSSCSQLHHTVAAHTVVIHGTRHWAGAWEEYSDLDIMQMIGRAVSLLPFDAF